MTLSIFGVTAALVPPENIGGLRADTYTTVPNR